MVLRVAAHDPPSRARCMEGFEVLCRSRVVSSGRVHGRPWQGPRRLVRPSARPLARSPPQRSGSARTMYQQGHTGRIIYITRQEASACKGRERGTHRERRRNPPSPCFLLHLPRLFMHPCVILPPAPVDPRGEGRDAHSGSWQVGPASITALFTCIRHKLWTSV